MVPVTTADPAPPRASTVPSSFTPAPWHERAAATTVVAAVLLASYWKVVDAEPYMRLAIGRIVAREGPLLAQDPFLYSIPGLRWRNGEWLGDLILYGAFVAGAEGAMVLLKLAVLSTGFFLLYRWARGAGGAPIAVVTLVVLLLAGAERRFIERNEMHLFWLLPAYGLVLARARANPRWLYALVPLGLLWANLHGSTTMGWVVLGAALADALFGPDRDPAFARRLLPIMALHPLFPLCGPDGLRGYDLFFDHLRHGKDIGRFISEWHPPALIPASVAQIPLHVLGVVGLLSFLPRANRARPGAFLQFAAGLYLGHTAERFLMVFGLLAIPPVAANLTRLARALPARGRRLRIAATAVFLLGATAAFADTVYYTHRRPASRDRPDQPIKAARWLKDHAPPGSRLFHGYDGVQWLMWEAPNVGLYITPHYSFDSDFMVRFLTRVLHKPEGFVAELDRLDVNLVLVRMGQMPPLRTHLDGAADWRLVFFDGYFSLFARDVPRNRELLARHAYRYLRARYALDYLDGVDDAALATDLERLAGQSRAFADAVRGYRVLAAVPAGVETTTAGGAALARARDLLAGALPGLPPAAALSAYLATAHLRLGELDRAREVVVNGLKTAPKSGLLLTLAARLGLEIGPPR